MENVYLIYGLNYKLIEKEVASIINGKTDVVRYDLLQDDVATLLDDASFTSIFGDQKVLIGENATFLTGEKSVINHDTDYLTRYLNVKDHDNVIIFTVLSEKLDDRKKIVKLLKETGTVIYKEKIDDKNLDAFVSNEFKRHGYKISLSNATHFVKVVGNNVDIILSELEKMMLYKDTEKEITTEDIDSLASKSVVNDVFELSNAIVSKDYKTMFACYDELMENEEPAKIVALLGNQFTLIYQAKLLYEEGYGEESIAKMLGVHPYRVKLAIKCLFSLDEAKEMVKKLYSLDLSIKSGLKDKNDALKMFMLGL